MAKSKFRFVVATLAIAAALAAITARAETPAQPALAPTLEAEFDNPPNSARPRVWWHWMNGNVTKDGIVQDLDWMVKVGIGGLQNFDVDLSTPVMVKNRLVYMTPEWKDAFRFAASEADKRGLELAIAASPGWSETGGPWVEPKDELKKVLWSETTVVGGKRFKGKLNPLPGVTGPFQDMPFFDPLAGLSGNAPAAKPQHGGDIAVLAVPAKHAPLAKPTGSDGSGKVLDVAALVDASLSSLIEISRGTAEAPATVVYDYCKPVTLSSASVFLPGAKWMFGSANVAPSIEASDDGKSWRKVADVAVTAVPTTVGFNSVAARWFRRPSPAPTWATPRRGSSRQCSCRCSRARPAPRTSLPSSASRGRRRSIASRPRPGSRWSMTTTSWASKAYRSLRPR